MTTLATPENVTALDRAAWWISKPQRWCRGQYESGNRSCAVGAIERHKGPGWSGLAFRLSRISANLYGAPHLENVNDEFGRIPAKHVIEALAAELRSQLL